jgi:hypothetical protein
VVIGLHLLGSAASFPAKETFFMRTVMTRHGLSALAMIGAIVLSACSGPASLSPTSPSGVAASAAVSSSSTGTKVSPTTDEIDPCEAVSPAGGEVLNGAMPDEEPCEPPPCEPGDIRNPTTGECEPPPCEPGETRNPTTGVCEPPPPPPPGDEGCTPGYWKNHTDSWPPTGYSTGQSLVSVFGSNALAGSLLDGLGFGGGSGVVGAKRILLRAAVSALLNSASPGVDYTRTTAQVIASVTTTLGGTREAMLALASALDADNNLGCPLN